MSTFIRAATVVDGTERPRYRADVLVDGPRITAILPTGGPAPAAARVLDADGLVLAPVGSDRGAVPAFPPVRFLGPPSEPDVPVSGHPALHKSRRAFDSSHAVLGHGLGIRVPR